MNNILIHRIFRYLISGGTAAFVNTGLLYLFTDIFGLYYLLSGVISFSIAVIVSFILQKRWTFEDQTTHTTRKKFVIFVVIAVINLIANTFLLYAFTDWFGLYHIYSQILASGIVAIWSFFIYKIVFKLESDTV